MTLPECGFTYRNQVCTEVGDHFCPLRPQKVVDFFANYLRHVEGRTAGKPFILTDWQKRDIIEPIFGQIRWSEEDSAYVRHYQISYLFISKKNGKSAIMSGLVLYMMAFDGEQSAKIYGLAADRDQASLIYDVAAAMVEQSPKLSKIFKITRSQKIIVHEKSHSSYKVLSADNPDSKQGKNPHLVIVDELLAQPNGRLYETMESAFGARLQPLMMVATTAGQDPDAWASEKHNYFRSVAEDPSKSPRTHTAIYEVPIEADPFDESNWYLSNPALGDFKSLYNMQQVANEAKSDPFKEASFRQYQLNQIVGAQTRWMPMPVYDDQGTDNDVWLTPDYKRQQFLGRKCFAGLDLGLVHDFTAWSLIFGSEDGESVDVMWRFWLPDEAFAKLNVATNNRAEGWAEAGWLTVTPGNQLEWSVVYEDIERDHNDFKIAEVDYDSHAAIFPIQAIQEQTGLPTFRVPQTFQGMAPCMHDLMRFVKAKSFRHHANPVARWQFDAVEVVKDRANPELIRPAKPKSKKESERRIDAVPASAMALEAFVLRGSQIEEQAQDLSGFW